MPVAHHMCCAGWIPLQMPVQCQAVQAVLSSCNVTMTMIIVMMIIGACDVGAVPQPGEFCVACWPILWPEGCPCQVELGGS